MQLKGVMHQRQPSLSYFLSLLISENRPIIAQKSRSELIPRQTLGRSSVTDSKQSARMTSNANQLLI
jgi:hypothetical protein